MNMMQNQAININDYVVVLHNQSISNKVKYSNTLLKIKVTWLTSFFVLIGLVDGPDNDH